MAFHWRQNRHERRLSSGGQSQAACIKPTAATDESRAQRLIIFFHTCSFNRLLLASEQREQDIFRYWSRRAHLTTKSTNFEHRDETPRGSLGPVNSCRILRGGCEYRLLSIKNPVAP
jgi:hypothetical protein